MDSVVNVVRTGLRGTVVFLVVLLMCGCASHQSTSRKERQLMASMMPMPNPPISEADAAREIEYSAGALLERAFIHFQRDQHRAASGAFRAAIGTGNLNDAGRVVAYWHIYLTEQEMRNPDEGAEALSSFVVVAQDVLEARSGMRYAVTSSGDFVDRFDLDNRVARARAFLAAKWAERIPSYGQSYDDAIVVKSESEANHFLTFAPPCSDAIDRVVHREVIESTAGGHLEHVALDCLEAAEPSEFYLLFEPDEAGDN